MLNSFDFLVGIFGIKWIFIRAPCYSVALHCVAFLAAAARLTFRTLCLIHSSLENWIFPNVAWHFAFDSARRRTNQYIIMKCWYIPHILARLGSASFLMACFWFGWKIPLSRQIYNWIILFFCWTSCLILTFKFIPFFCLFFLVWKFV